jgi:predicted choloylglycine hydrolase
MVSSRDKVILHHTDSRLTGVASPTARRICTVNNLFAQHFGCCCSSNYFIYIVSSISNGASTVTHISHKSSLLIVDLLLYSKHFTANKPAKMKVSRKISTRKHTRAKKMSNNPLTNVYNRLQTKRSSSRVITVKTKRYRKTDLISQLYKTLGKSRSTSRDKAITEVEEQVIEDRFGDVPM